MSLLIYEIIKIKLKRWGICRFPHPHNH